MASVEREHNWVQHPIYNNCVGPRSIQMWGWGPSPYGEVTSQ